MPRPISWIPILEGLHHWACHAKKAQVTSVDIQRKFQIQPRSAQQLMEMMEREIFGGTTFVRMEVLRDWLTRVMDAHTKGGEPAVRKLFAEIRTTEKPGVINRRIVDMEKTEAEALQKASAIMDQVAKPEGLRLRRGRIDFTFATMEEVAEGLYWLAHEMQDDLYFRGRFCPGTTPPLPSPAPSPTAPLAPSSRPSQTSSPDPTD